MSRLAHLVVAQEVEKLRRTNDSRGADRLEAAVAEIATVAEARWPEGSTPVSTDVWREIVALVPAHQMDGECPVEIVVRDWLRAAVDDAVRYDHARACIEAAGLVKNPDERGLVSIYEDLVKIRSAAERAVLDAEGGFVACPCGRQEDTADLDFIVDLRSALRGKLELLRVGEDHLDDRLRQLKAETELQVKKLRQELAETRTLLADEEGVCLRLSDENLAQKDEIARLSAELDAMAQRAVCETASAVYIEILKDGEELDAQFAEEPTQESEAAKIEEAFEAYKPAESPERPGGPAPQVSAEGAVKPVASAPGFTTALPPSNWRPEGDEARVAQIEQAQNGSVRVADAFGGVASLPTAAARHALLELPVLVGFVDDVVRFGSSKGLQSAIGKRLDLHHFAGEVVDLSNWVKGHAEALRKLSRPDDKREYRALLTKTIVEAKKSAKAVPSA